LFSRCGGDHDGAGSQGTGIDGLLRTRDVFGWSLERSNEWLLAHVAAAVRRPPAESSTPN
jgi:hypothetical protein